ncbi:RHS repeat domain-containing protein [Microbulbifer spongiae]|uniref:RHS repeat-associated core domain-containing protein n=1 Tax=Microbulbifer spongiae TaxID=2944933 RepID=A0ABY9EG85_9GAMM|nr:RHS repeat-associated core domain-containing protein [Microbulbifer sp. MI-G]WKD50594.1 RHS repeat-associated core domain-containing protein [Microbulbifer sp. MI-G]
MTSKRGYTGHEHLDRTGLIHMNGRIYDPTLGRFLSPDPIVQAPTYSQSWNRYSYVLNNPMSLVDPTGYTAEYGFDDDDEEERRREEERRKREEERPVEEVQVVGERPNPNRKDALAHKAEFREYLKYIQSYSGIHTWLVDGCGIDGLECVVVVVGEKDAQETKREKFIRENFPEGSHGSCGGVKECFAWYWYGREARNQTLETWRGLLSFTGNQADAFRHAYFAYKLTESVGPEPALRMLHEHEFNNLTVDNYPVPDTIMDIHNNKAGAQLAIDNPGLKGEKLINLIKWNDTLMNSPPKEW